MSYPRRTSSPRLPYGDENYQQVGLARAPTITDPQSHHQYYPYPPGQLQRQYYDSSGADLGNPLNHSAYPGSSHPGNQTFNPNHYFVYPPAVQQYQDSQAGTSTTPALADRTQAVTNTTHGQSGRKRKRKAVPEAERQSKRRSIGRAPEQPIPPVHGIGPINPAQAVTGVLSHPALARTRGPSLGTLVDSHAGAGSGRSVVASDVWYFVVGVESDVVGSWPDNRPVPLPPPDELELRLSKDRPNPTKYNHVCCQLCMCVSSFSRSPLPNWLT